MEASLGKLLQFQTRKRSATFGHAVTGNAQILIFTGVRYERDIPPPPKTDVDNKRGRRKRG